MAFGDKYFNRGAVTLCFMGDGAVRGSFHETLNLSNVVGNFQLFLLLKIMATQWVRPSNVQVIILKFGN